MLALKRLKSRIIDLKPDEPIRPLQIIMEAHGELGIKTVMGILANPNDSEQARVNALMVLGTQRLNLPTGDPVIMALLEDLAETAPPELDRVCFVGVYANAIKGRAEAAALVDKFKGGTERQRELFQTTDHEFMKGLAAREIALKHQAALMQASFKLRGRR